MGSQAHPSVLRRGIYTIFAACSSPSAVWGAARVYRHGDPGLPGIAAGGVPGVYGVSLQYGSMEREY